MCRNKNICWFDVLQTIVEFEKNGTTCLSTTYAMNNASGVNKRQALQRCGEHTMTKQIIGVTRRIQIPIEQKNTRV
jgi:hypothetical protein